MCKMIRSDLVTDRHPLEENKIKVYMSKIIYLYAAPANYSS